MGTVGVLGHKKRRTGTQNAAMPVPVFCCFTDMETVFQQARVIRFLHGDWGFAI